MASAVRCALGAPRAQGVRCQAKGEARPAQAAVPRDQQQQQVGQRWAAGLLGAAAALSLAVAPPAFAAEPFLKSTGAAASHCLLN